MAEISLPPVSYYPVQHQAHGQTPTLIRSTRTFREAAESYLADRGEDRYLQSVVTYFGDTPLDMIHPFDIRQMAEVLYPNAKGSTRNRQAVTPARAVMLHAYDRGWCHPIRVKRFKEEKTRVTKAAGPTWLWLFCRQCDADDLNHVAAIVMFMATTGARVSEAVRLRWADVDLSKRTALLLRTKTSRNSLRSLTDDVTARLQRMQPFSRPDQAVFGYSSRWGVNERIRAVCERAKIPYKSPHTCGRKTFATMSLDMGISPVNAMAAGGWKSSKVFMEVYAEPKENVSRSVADQFSYNATRGL